MKGGQDPIILRWTIFRNTFHGKIRFKVAFSCLPRAVGSQLVPVGTLSYPCKTGENLYFKYGPASVGGRAPCSLC